ncbi:MAG: aldehyde dehydrogenase family protein [Cellvibrionales bacterium]|nr:aldehyde dehydrogenase family protein [Cellvibrionales bacterium]
MSDINWHERAKNTEFTVRNFIDGEYKDCVGSTTIEKYAPNNGELLYSFAAGDGSEVEQAVAAAKRTYKEGVWSKLSIGERKAVISKLADLVEENAETFALYESLDVGKPIMNALHADVMGHTVGGLRSCVESIDKLVGNCGVDAGSLIYQAITPIGVVAGIAGWNFPLSLAAGKIGPALITGNSIVLKPSEFTSLSAGLLAELATQAGVPAGVVNVVHGGPSVGDALARHMDIDMLAFVGSSATGKLLMKAAGESNMKRLNLECGGKSPYIVYDDCEAYLDMVAADVVDTAFPNQGALCVAGTRLLVQDSIREKLMPKILEHAAKIQPKDPLDAECTFGAMMNEAHMNKVLGYIEAGKADGAELIYGGKQVNQESGGFYVEPTIYDGVKLGDRISQEEIFGPVLSVLSFKDEAEAVEIANGTCFGLAAYVATQNLGRAQRMGRDLKAGMIQVFGAADLSGGGVSVSVEGQKQSGFGYAGGIAGLAAYTNASTVFLFS